MTEIAALSDLYQKGLEHLRTLDDRGAPTQAIMVAAKEHTAIAIRLKHAWKEHDEQTRSSS